MGTLVTETPAASSNVAIRHFEDMLAYCIDPSSRCPLFVEHCEAVAAEIDVRRRWLGEQERRVSFGFGELAGRQVTLEVANLQSAEASARFLHRSCSAAHCHQGRAP